MDEINWSIKTSPDGEAPEIISYYLLNNLGIFIKREKRISKNETLTALTGLRVGYTAIPGTNYRAAPMDRNAILWHKITSVTEKREAYLAIKGNQRDEISIHFNIEDRDAVLRYINTMRLRHPAVAAPDEKAAAWICWRDDDDWGDPFQTLSDMVNSELSTQRFIEPEVLAETELVTIPAAVAPSVPEAADNSRKLCTCCGATLTPAAKFCGKCGTRVR